MEGCKGCENRGDCANCKDYDKCKCECKCGKGEAPKTEALKGCGGCGTCESCKVS